MAPELEVEVGHTLDMRYTPRFDEAVALAVHDFRRVTRKATTIPYVAHLFAVTAFVAEGGGDEDQMIAAILHDWLEDVPGASPDVLEERFGGRVRRIVEALTDTTEHPKPPWKERKERFLAHIRNQTAEVKLVCCADKLHNAQGLVRDLEQQGLETLDRFRGGREGSVWYYTEVSKALADGFDHWLLTDLDLAVGRIHVLTGTP